MKIMTMAIMTTALIMSINPMGMLRFETTGTCIAVGADFGGVGTTGAGAVLIMRVKSLGPAFALATGIPPIGDNAPAPPLEPNSGGGRIDGPDGSGAPLAIGAPIGAPIEAPPAG